MKSAGELASASQVTINGKSAAGGQTLFSNSRIKTAKQGRATINLGKLGRLELGPETDLTLKFSPGTVDGELVGGRVMLSSSSGVSVSVKTAKGLVTSAGKTATVMTIEMLNDQDRVAAHLGEVNVASAGKNDRILAGEEIALVKQQQNTSWQHRKLPLTTAGLLGTGGVVAATTIGQAGQAIIPAAVTSQPISAPLATLLNAGVNYSLLNLVSGRASRDPDAFFATTITCRDSDSPFCRRRSITTP
ncbi:MAG: hypothetical protein ABI977_22840 [Acidobacteriota bacterium]